MEHIFEYLTKSRERPTRPSRPSWELGRTLKKNTTFRKLYLFPSSGEVGEGRTERGSVSEALCSLVFFFRILDDGQSSKTINSDSHMPSSEPCRIYDNETSGSKKKTPGGGDVEHLSDC
jgi:hypothetical protein